MGNEQSAPVKQNIHLSLSSKLYEYNWIPSFSSLTNHTMISRDNNSDLLNETSESQSQETQFPEYIDLRREISCLPEGNDQFTQVCKSVVTIINYSLLKSKRLYTFPPSYNYLMYLLKHVIGSQQLHSFGHLSEVIRKFGICSENDYVNYPEQPNDETFMLANPYRHIKLINIPLDITKIKTALAKETPLLLGMPIYSNFLKTETDPKLTLSNSDDILLGGFCGVIVGYQETDHHFIVLTTKGKRWGDRGYVFIPYGQIIKTGAEIVQLEIRDELVILDIEKKPCQNTVKLDNLETVINGHNHNHNHTEEDEACLKTIF